MKLSELLKSATREIHQETESHSFTEAIRNHSLTPGQYKALLKSNYHFHSGIITAIQPWFKEKPKYHIAERNRVGHIEHDLLALDIGIPKTEKTFPVENFTKSLGALYVLEGSTLGGRMILKAALNTEGVEQSGAFKFYEGYGNDTGKMWKQFLSLMDEETFSNEERQIVVEGALEAFRFYRMVSVTEEKS